MNIIGKYAGGATELNDSVEELFEYSGIKQRVENLVLPYINRAGIDIDSFVHEVSELLFHVRASSRSRSTQELVLHQQAIEFTKNYLYRQYSPSTVRTVLVYFVDFVENEDLRGIGSVERESISAQEEVSAVMMEIRNQLFTDEDKVIERLERSRFRANQERVNSLGL